MSQLDVSASPRKGISLKALADKLSMEDAVQTPAAAQRYVGLAHIIGRISDENTAQAERVATVLRDRGFNENDLDDLVYKLAGHICSRHPDRADTEYAIANEVNSQPMSRQLAVLAAAASSEAAFHISIQNALKINLNLTIAAEW